jgi:IS4 transposase
MLSLVSHISFAYFVCLILPGMDMNQSTVAAAGNLEGKMFLYSKPELLTVEDHGRLGLTASERPFDFVKSIRVVPIAAAEIASAQKNYPIIFSDLKTPALLAVVSVLDGVNLFVDDNGKWDESAYLPAYIRCHPFALAPRPNDQYAVVIDRAASVITENAEQPFFNGKDLAPPIQARVDFCAQFSAHRPATKALCDKLVELDLLSGQQATYKPDAGGEEQSIGSYVAVDFDKVKELDASTLRQLHLDGTLSAIYAHRFSLENWFRLLERRNRRQSAA